MKGERSLGLSSLIDHESPVVRAAAFLYLGHILLQGKISTLELLAFFTIVCLGWALARGDIRFSWHILYYPLIVYGIASLTSTLLSEIRQEILSELMLWFKMLIFPAALILFREVPRLRELAISAHLIFAAYASLWGLTEFALLGRRDLEHRITGPLPHVMTFSGVLMPLSLMALLLWIHQRKQWQLAVALLSMTTLLLTLTRSVWLGWTVAIVMLIVAARTRLAFYILPAAILFITFLPLPFFSRMISTFDLQQSSNFDRIRMLEAGVEMIKDYPLLGVGPGNVKESYALYRRQDAPRPRPPHLHNNPVQLWAERGVLGLAAYLVLILMFFRLCAREWHGPRRMWAEIGLAMIISLTVAGLFEFNFGDTEVFYILLNLMALVIASLEGGGANLEARATGEPPGGRPPLAAASNAS
jgi:O-antigen ligase